MKIMRAIVAGQHDPAALATYRAVRWQASEATMRQALTGHYRREQVCALRQALELYDSSQARIDACDQESAATLKALQDDTIAMATLPAARSTKRRQVNAPQCDVRAAVLRGLGVDLRQLHGIGASTALKLGGECGMDMSRWPTVTHCTSWLTLAPGKKISGGKVLSTTTRRSAHRAAAILRWSAVNVGRTHTALGAFYRR
jgi:transposase